MKASPSITGRSSSARATLVVTTMTTGRPKRPENRRPDRSDGRIRAALYARYSSDLQSAASIDDQFRACHEHAEL